MAKGFQYREIEGFFTPTKIGEAWETTSQLAMTLNGVDTDDSVKSSIRFLGESEHQDFYKYHVTHETIKPYRVRFNQITRDSVILIVEFELFVAKNKTYLWADTKQTYVNELLKRIKETEPAYGASEREIDLVKLSEMKKVDITGGHFNQLKIADVKAASIFGPGVGESQDWKRYEDSGEVTAVVVNFPYKGEGERLMITRNGGIVLYTTFDEKEAIELIELANDLIGQYTIRNETIN